MKIWTHLNIDVEALNRDDLERLKAEIEKEIAARETLKTEPKKFQIMYYTGLMERHWYGEVIRRICDDHKCTTAEAMELLPRSTES